MNDTEALRRYITLGIEPVLACGRDPAHPVPHVLEGPVLLCVRCGWHEKAGPGTIARAHRRVGAADGAALRDEAIARVDAAADSDWKRWAERAVLEICRECETFTTDEAAERLDKLLTTAGVSVSTRDARAWGGIMRRAASEGWCEATDDMRLTVNPSAHRRPKRVWRSLLH